MADTTPAIKSAKKADATPEGRYQRWREEVVKAEKELDKFHRAGQKIVREFLDDRQDGLLADFRKFNIFTANVGIMQSVLYAKLPKVQITRRFNQYLDEPARLAAYLLQNCVMQEMDERESDFDQTMREAVEDRLVPGLGAAWLRLETETEQKELPEVLDPLTGAVIQPAASYEQISEQEVCIDHVHWADFLYSPCRVWAECRWTGRRVYMSFDKLVERFGEELANLIPLDYKPDSKNDSTENAPDNPVFQQAVIYELWDRETRTVIWLSKGYPKLLDEKPDPLGLDDFFPCPKPLFGTMSTSNCVPRADYALFQDQYEELNQVNNRISLLVAACKVVGVYDSGSSGVQKMLQEGIENTLVPADNWAMFAEKGGIKGAVDWLPLDQVIAALDKLRQAREDIKGQIYELTGISDIVRGDTKASETLGAQKIKAQFASTRIQKLQDEVARFAQDILRIKAEIVCRHFDPSIIVKLSNLEYTPDVANTPLVQSAFALLKDEDSFNWRVKVQADTLGMVDYESQKQEKVEFTNAVATFLQSAATTLKALPSAAPLVFETLKFAVSGFKGSQELEGVFDESMKQIMAEIQQQREAAKNQPPPEVVKMQAQLKMEAERNQQKLAIEQAESQQRLAADAAEHQQEMQFRQEEHRMDLVAEAQSAEMKMAADAQKHDAQMAQIAQKGMMQINADARRDAGKENS